MQYVAITLINAIVMNRTKEMEKMMNTHPNFYEWKHLEQSQEPVAAWSPRVDPESRLPFMPNEPIDLMKQGNFQV